MESFFDFLIDNPVIAIILISWLFSALFGKKNKEKRAEQKKATEKKAEQKKAAWKEAIADAKNSPNSTFRNAISKLEEAIDQAERNLNAKAQKAQATAGNPPKPKVPVAVISPPASPAYDPYAFHSLTTSEDRTLEGRDYDSTAKDYDLTADDYDLTAKDYDVAVQNFDKSVKGFDSDSDAYAFHLAGKGPAQRDFHQSNFRAFQSAHGLSKEDQTAGRDAYDRPSASKIASSLFANRNDVRRAFIMQEILNRPRGLRR